jgi:hypothetical protein
MTLVNRAVGESLGLSPESSPELQGPSFESSPKSWDAVTRVKSRVRRSESESSRKSERLSLKLIFHNIHFE